MDQAKRKKRVAALSVASNTLLTLFKLAVGLATGSISILSESIHSSIDLLASVIAWVAVREASRPPDSDHPFGHGKMENISGTIEALLIFLAAGWIAAEACEKLIRPQPIDRLGLGVAVMGVSMAVNALVSRALYRVGRETDSIALKADGLHLETDVYTSAGVMGGLAAIWLGESLMPGVSLRWIDPVAAIAVAMLIVRAAWQLVVASSRDLMDVCLPENELAWIQQYVDGWKPTIAGFHRLRTRKAGGSRFIQFHILVPPQMSVEESHRIHDLIVAGIKEHFTDSQVTIHIEPAAPPSRG